MTPAAAALALTLSATAPAAAAAPPLDPLPAPLPTPVRAMIAKAAEGGDPAVLATVLSVARLANPDSLAEIDALAAELAPAAAPAAPPPALAFADAPPAPDLAVWKGSLELGGAVAQGRTETVGGYGVIDVSRTTPGWSQRLTWRGDYQETNGRASTQRFSLAYEPRARLSDHRYAFGLAQYEHDRFLGVERRYTVGAGLGVQLARSEALKVAVDLGPALRLTETREFGQERAAAGRASLNIRWLPTDRVTLRQEAALYADEQQTSAKSITALETLLFGPLKGRLSYNMQYERDARVARSDLDTTTRASILYTF